MKNNNVPVTTSNPKREDNPLKLNMTFEQAMKKALNTPLPASEKRAKKKVEKK